MSEEILVKKPLCIIPARGGSKRLPRKNLALLGGKSLLTYTIESAIESNIFEDICVSSEDDEILSIVSQYDFCLPIKRPPELATDTAQVKHVCLHLLEDFASQGKQYENFSVLLTTNPFRTAKDIQASYDIFKRSDANYVMSLVPYSHPPQRAVCITDGEIKPYFGIEYMKQTQLLQEVYRHDGSIIFAKSHVFREEKEFYGTKTIPYFMPIERSVDIDNYLDLVWAEFLLSRLQIGKTTEYNL